MSRNTPRRPKRCPAARMLASDLDLEHAKATGKLHPDVLDVIARGFASRSAGEQIAAAIELRKEISKDYTAGRLGRMVIHLRDRFYIAVGPAAAERYRATILPTPTKDDLRGEAEALLEQLKLIYSMSVERDSHLSDIRLLSLSFLGAVAALMAAMCLFTPGFLAEPQMVEGVRFAALNLESGAAQTAALVPAFGSLANYMMVLTFAATGSVVSIIQRSHKASQLGPVATDPIAQINGLRYGLFGLLMAGLTGPVSALLLIALFASDDVKLGELSPSFVPCDGEPRSEFRLMDHCAALKSHADVAKLLVWSFVAGFTERLLPDVLDRFSRAARKEGDAAKAA